MIDVAKTNLNLMLEYFVTLGNHALAFCEVFLELVGFLKMRYRSLDMDCLVLIMLITRIFGTEGWISHGISLNLRGGFQ